MEIALLFRDKKTRRDATSLFYISWHLSAPSFTDANPADKMNTPTGDSGVFKSDGNLAAI